MKHNYTQEELDATLAELQINREAWVGYLTSEEGNNRAAAAINMLFDQLEPAMTVSELHRRGVNLDDLCRGSWVVVRTGRDRYSLAVVLLEVAPNKTYRCWFGDDTTENVNAIDIWQHLRDYYPAPIALNGKTVLEKAKIQFTQIENALTGVQECSPTST